MVTTTCKTCQRSFLTYPCRLRKGIGKYCSNKCVGISMLGKPTWNKGKKSPRMVESNRLGITGMTGRKHTEESKRKMSLTRKGLGIKPPLNFKPKIKKICEYCRKIYEILPCHSKRKYCSIFCSNKGKNLGRHHSYEWRLKLSLRRKGKNNPAYIDGRNKRNRRSRKSLKYKIWRENVFKRDNYTCLWCGARNGNGKDVILQADHIKPWALYPKLRYRVDNGRTLCFPCHKKTDSYKKNIKL